MAPIPKQYGSIPQEEDKDAPTLELLPHGPSADICNRVNSSPIEEGKTRHHRCIPYLLTAGLCLVMAKFWHDHASAYDGPAKHGQVIVNDGGRVPMPPALSTLDPRELKFRPVKREGLASPSKAWGEYLTDEDDKDRKKFVPLPTNQWYLVCNYCYVHHFVLYWAPLLNMFTYHM